MLTTNEPVFVDLLEHAVTNNDPVLYAMLSWYKSDPDHWESVEAFFAETIVTLSLARAQQHEMLVAYTTAFGSLPEL